MSSPAAARSVRLASAAVFAVFVLNGLNFASWAARLPAVRDGLGLDAAQMGLLLLVASLGSVVALPLSGLVVERLGARTTIVVFATANVVGLTTAALATQAGLVPLVAAGMLVYGVGTAMWDAAMNLQGAAVEQQLGYTVMPRYHAGFSFGTMAAAAIAAVLARAHVPVAVHLPALLVVSFVAVLVAVRALPPDTGRAHRPPATLATPAGDLPAPTDQVAAPTAGRARGARSGAIAWFEARTLLIGLVVLAAALTEGSANDWVSLAVVDGFDTTHTVGALAFGLFVTAMTVMRLFGTRLLDRYGRVPVLRLCGALAIVGLLTFGLAGPVWLAALGIVAWGAGAALGFPVGMSAASDDPMRAAQRVAVVSTIGYSAFLAGPPLLGLLAQHVGYRHALLAILVPAVIGLLVAQAAAPLRSGPPDDALAAAPDEPAGEPPAYGMPPGAGAAADDEPRPTLDA